MWKWKCKTYALNLLKTNYKCLGNGIGSFLQFWLEHVNIEQTFKIMARVIVSIKIKPVIEWNKKVTNHNIHVIQHKRTKMSELLQYKNCLVEDISCQTSTYYFDLKFFILLTVFAVCSPDLIPSLLILYIKYNTGVIIDYYSLIIITECITVYDLHTESWNKRSPHIWGNKIRFNQRCSLHSISFCNNNVRQNNLSNKLNGRRCCMPSQTGETQYRCYSFWQFSVTCKLSDDDLKKTNVDREIIFRFVSINVDMAKDVEGGRVLV